MVGGRTGCCEPGRFGHAIPPRPWKLAVAILYLLWLYLLWLCLPWQLLINYANEKLQHLFNEIVFENDELE